VIDARTGAIVTDVTGKAVGTQTIALLADSLDPGSYQYVLRTLKCGKPGTAEARFSQAFTIPIGAQTAPPLPPPTLPLLPAATLPLPTLLPIVPAAG
jgi:hypothetical protein